MTTPLPSHRSRPRAWNARFKVYVESRGLSLSEVARELHRSPSLIYFWLTSACTPREKAQEQVRKWSRGRVKPDSEMAPARARKNSSSLKRTGTDN